MEKRKMYGLLLVTVFLALGAALLLFRFWDGNEGVQMEVEALERTERGIAPETGFSLTVSSALKEEELREMLETEPDMGEYTLSGGGKSWVLVPGEPLERNSIYQIRFQDREGQLRGSFAFQTESDLQVNGFFPYSDWEGVALDTGIEITLNADNVDARDGFQIFPETPGTLETRGYRIIFKPREPLKPGTLYRVILRAGLTAPNGMELREGYVNSFTTVGEGTAYRRGLQLSGAFSETFLTGDPLVVALSGGDTLDEVEFDYTLHRFSGIGGYQNVLLEYDTFYRERYGLLSELEIDTAGLEEVASYKSKLFRKDERWGNLYAILPSDLPQGCYVATVSGVDSEGNGQFAQKLLQIGNLAVYTQSLNGETLVWLNSADSGKPMPGVRVILTDQEKPETIWEGVTDEEGIARVSTEKTVYAYLTLEQDGKPIYFAPVTLTSQRKDSLPEQYYGALYTDREAYQPTDVIRFWGVLQPRSKEKSLPEWVYAELYHDSNQPLYRIKVPVKPDGTVEGTIQTESLRQDTWYSLGLSNGKEEYYRKIIAIRPYTKPAYLIAIEPEKAAFFADEPIKLQVSATYFDGTPVAGGKLTLNGGQLEFDLPQELLTLDEQGKGLATGHWVQQEGIDPVGAWRPYTVYVTASSGDVQDVQVTERKTVTILPSRTAARLEPGDNPGELVLHAAKVDPSRLEKEGGAFFPYMWNQPHPFERVAGVPTDITALLEVNGTEFRQVPTGSYYDYINKVTRTSYRVEVVRSVVDTIPVSTVGGKAVISGLPYAQDGKAVEYWYSLRFPGEVAGIRAVKEEYRMVPAMAVIPDYSLRRYSFANNRDGARSMVARMGEPIPLGLYNNGLPVENHGIVFYFAYQNKELDTGTFTTEEKQISMKEDYLPNVYFSGAYFDGRHIFSIEPYSVSYEFDEKTLDIELETDKPSYEPGETARVSLSVRDAKGNPVAASACIGVVDESVFAVMEQELKLADQIYARVFYSGCSQNVSYVEYNLDAASSDMGGGGGGGDDSGPLREDFQDTAFFQPVNVGADGKGTVEIALPDNVTEWRVTAAAVTPNLDAGDQKLPIKATLPFSLRPLVSESYLEGDDLVISLQGAGTAVDLSTPISYRVILEDAAGQILQEKSLTGKIGEQAPLSFGKHLQGNYSVTVEARAGGYQDAMKLPVTVQKQGITVPLFKTIPLEEVEQVESALYPLNLTIFDENSQPFISALQTLAAMDGDRTELLAASYRARVLLNNIQDPENRGGVSLDARLDQIQSYGEGVKSLPQGQPDVGTTARMLVAAPGLVHAGDGEAFLQSVAWNPASTPEEPYLAMMGLAAMNKPVLLDLQQMAAREGLTTAQRLYVGVGLACLGDFSGGEQILEGLKDSIVLKGKLCYVEGENEEERLKNTAGALMLASLLGDPRGDSIMRWLNTPEARFSSEQTNREAYCGLEPYTLEVLTYVEHFTLPQKEKASRFRCRINGETKEMTLDEQGCKTISLSAQGLRDAQIKPLSGKLMAGVQYTGNREEAQKEGELSKELVRVEKHYLPLNGPLAVNSRARVELRVTFDPAAPSGAYRVSDYIPSGMRYLSLYEGAESAGLVEPVNPYSDWAYGFVNCNKQQVDGTIYRNLESPDPALDPAVQKQLEDGFLSQEEFTQKSREYANRNTYTLTYFVSGVLPGEFVAESAFVSSAHLEEVASSPRGVLQIS